MAEEVLGRIACVSAQISGDRKMFDHILLFLLLQQNAAYLTVDRPEIMGRVVDRAADAADAQKWTPVYKEIK